MRPRDMSYVVILFLGLCAFYTTLSGIIMDVRGVPTFFLHAEMGYACAALGALHLALNAPLIRSYAHRWRRRIPAQRPARGRRDFLQGTLAMLAGVVVGFGVGRKVPAEGRSVPTEQGGATPPPQPITPGAAIALPPPSPSGLLLDKAIRQRRSRRDYAPLPLSQGELAGLLWAAQGITDPVRSFRAAPSAGATYPLEAYALVHRVEGLAAGLYRYRPTEHAIEPLREGHFERQIMQIGIGQGMLAQAGVVIILSAVPARTERRYGARAERYILLEAGHAAQNIYLAAEGYGLGACAVGAFDDEALNAFLQIDGRRERALYMMAVGKRRV